MTRVSRDKPADCAVSEAIGFLLIFSIVIAGIGLVTLYAYPMLLQEQVSADEKIMEKNMIVLQNDVKSLTYKTVPYKETSMKIGGGALTIHNSSSNGPSFRIYDSAGQVFLPENRTGELRYESIKAQTAISLQNGAVIKSRMYSSGSVMLAEPRWFYDEDTQTMTVNLVSFTSTELMAREGIGTIRMRLNSTDYQFKTGTDISPPIYLDYTPDSENTYEAAWDNYFTKLDMTQVSTLPPTITYRFPNSITTLVIKRTDIQILAL